MEVDDHDNASTDSDPFARQPWKKARAESSGAVANGDDTSIDEESLFTNKSDKPITKGKAKAGKVAKAKAKKVAKAEAKKVRRSLKKKARTAAAKK